MKILAKSIFFFENATKIEKILTTIEIFRNFQKKNRNFSKSLTTIELFRKFDQIRNFWKNRNFSKFAKKNRNFSKIMTKIELFRKFN